jgi:hypothetical protein
MKNHELATALEEIADRLRGGAAEEPAGLDIDAIVAGREAQVRELAEAMEYQANGRFLDE